MRIVGRHDLLLLGGLTLALLVVFARPIRYMLDAARDIEQQWGLALVPALIILAVVFLFQQQIKRQEIKLQATAAEANARQALARAEELEALVGFGQALARALDAEALRDALGRHLRLLVKNADPWVLVRADDRWETLLGLRTASAEGDDGPAATATIGAIAGTVLTTRLDTLDRAQGVKYEGHTCFPLVVGDAPLGVLGVKGRAGELDEGEQRMLATAAALTALAWRRVQLIQEIRDNSLRDGLTGCFNRTHGVETLEIELRRARRTRSPLSVLMFDVDHFKTINDHHGHLCGDAVLAAIGRRMRETLRNSDLKCRYGGEEFLVLLPDTPLEGARHVAESLRRAIGGTPLVWDGATVSVTASFGVTLTQLTELDARQIIARADRALYEAKHAGRNCIRVADEEPAPPRAGDAPAGGPDLPPT